MLLKSAKNRLRINEPKLDGTSRLPLTQYERERGKVDLTAHVLTSYASVFPCIWDWGSLSGLFVRLFLFVCLFLYNKSHFKEDCCCKPGSFFHLFACLFVCVLVLSFGKAPKSKGASRNVSFLRPTTTSSQSLFVNADLKLNLHPSRFFVLSSLHFFPAHAPKIL